MMPDWLRHGDLPPTGSPVFLDTAAAPLQVFPAYQPVWVQSGTAALALALLIARQRSPEIPDPRVILPAYGCPDLVAAAVFAGVQPVLVDIGADDPGYNLAALQSALDDSIVAVVAVNFLGIRERLVAIRDLLRAYPQALLIEDNAQWFPEASANGATELGGDLVCLSFGRGKPVSLLGGGALLVRAGSEVGIPTVLPAQKASAQVRLKALVFNLLLHRRVYWLVNRNPLISLGQTVYKPLAEIRNLDALRMQALGMATARYLASSRGAETGWDAALAAVPGVEPLADNAARRGRLLRYPVLCRDQRERDALRLALNTAGLGESAMYQRPLPLIDGVDGKVTVSGEYRNAQSFAARLLTLPTHPGVTAADIERGRDLMARITG